jgi:hypothetical protein
MNFRQYLIDFSFIVILSNLYFKFYGVTLLAFVIFIILRITQIINERNYVKASSQVVKKDPFSYLDKHGIRMLYSYTFIFKHNGIIYNKDYVHDSILKNNEIFIYIDNNNPAKIYLNRHNFNLEISLIIIYTGSHQKSGD